MPAAAQAKKDSSKLAPRSLRILTNIYLPAQLCFSNKFQSAEVSVESWQPKGWAWVGELGYASRTRNDGTYNVQGVFGRIGIEKGFWEKKPARRENGSWQTGLRLAFASFNYQNSAIVQSPYWGDIAFTDNQKGLFALWTEWHTSLRGRIGKRFFMGPMLRVKMLLLSSNNTFTTHPPEIVGYGVRRGLQAEVGYWVGIWLGK